MNKRTIAILAFLAQLILTACAANLKPTDTAPTAPEVVSAKELFAGGGGDGSKALLGGSPK